MLRATLFTPSASSFQYEHEQDENEQEDNRQDQHYALLVVIHHIAADGWSMALVTKEVNTYYQQYAELAEQENQDAQSASQSNSQRTSQLTKLDTCHSKDEAYLQYSHYAWWQRTQAAPYIQHPNTLTP